jgi:hypothetical protein
VVVKFVKLSHLVSQGQNLYRHKYPEDAHSQFSDWVEAVSNWLGTVAPDGSLSAEWGSLPVSGLFAGVSSYYDDSAVWQAYDDAVRQRLAWLGRMPSMLKSLQQPQHTPAHSELYVDSARISELHEITAPNYDLSKLLELCNELNICYANQCYMAVAMLVRAILDHVPPIFNVAKFSEVASNYQGSKSFKESMGHLQNSLRNIADHHLHVHVRKKEVLPTKTQVSFQADLDVLLAEIVRLLK